MQGRRKAAFFYAKYFYSKRHIPLFSFPYNCKRKASGTNTSRKASACTTRAKSESKRLQRYARDGKPRGKALSKYA